MDSWSAIKSGTSVLTSASSTFTTASKIANDPYFQKVVASQKGLILDNQDVIVSFLLASSQEDLGVLEGIVASSPSTDFIDDLSSTGITPLIYAIFFSHLPVVEFLLENGANPDLADTSICQFTPIMWAVYLNQLDTVKVLFNHQADPQLSPGSSGKNAISLVFPENVEMYEYFKSHNLFKADDDVKDDFYQLFDTPGDALVDDLTAQIKLQSINADTIYEDDSERNAEEREREKVALYVEERILSEDPVLFALAEFDYAKLVPDQYIKFADSDIPSLLDYIFNLSKNHSGPIQHETKLPATIVFQLLRYAHLKADSAELSQFLFECFIARLRSVTNTKSGVFAFQQSDTSNTNSNTQLGDIVLLSYWLSVIQFLHFYLSKANMYKAYPKFLQELINTVQSLIATVSFSVNSRLNVLIDDCLLDFTNLVDVSNAMYAKDWNLFSKKKHPSSYEDILNMLYPPTEKEMMKPSPIRFVQVLGALDYVLKLHQVDSLFKMQTYSQVFYSMNCAIFNRIISQLKYCSRVKAIQIRLNILSIEDWLRGHTYNIAKPDTIGGIEKLLPSQDINQVLNMLQTSPPRAPDAKKEQKSVLLDPHYLPFYYTSLFQVGKAQLLPTIELLQWLQCLSKITDEDDLVTTINQFDSLNYFQILKTMVKLYKYEVNEPKVPKPVVNFMKKLQSERGEAQVNTLKQHYMTQATFLLKEVYIYLNPNFVFPVALPNLQELINGYGPGLGGVRVYRGKKYQPSLPINIQDDVDELLAKNKEEQETTYDPHYKNDDDEVDETAQNTNDVLDHTGYQSNNTHSKNTLDIKHENMFKGDQLFKEVQLPSSLAHKNWGEDDIDVNPW